MDFIDFIKSSIKIYFLDNDSADYINNQVKWYTPLILIWSIFIISTIGYIILNKEEVIQRGIIFIVVLMSMPIIGIPILIFISIGLLYLLLRVFGGKSSYKDLIKFSLTLFIFPFIAELILYTFIFTIFILIGLDPTNNGFISIIDFLFTLWIIYISIIIFSQISKISKLRTFFALILFPIIFFAIVFVWFILETI